MTERMVYCERCQLKVPARLATFDVGVRGGTAARCAACNPVLGEEARQEVIAMRRAKLAPAGRASAQKGQDHGQGANTARDRAN